MACSNYFQKWAVENYGPSGSPSSEEWREILEEDESQDYRHKEVIHSAESLEVLAVAANEEMGHVDQEHQSDVESDDSDIYNYV